MKKFFNLIGSILFAILLSIFIIPIYLGFFLFLLVYTPIALIISLKEEL